MSLRQGFYAAQGLAEDELGAIRALAEECNNYEQLDLKLNWPTLHSRSKQESSDFLYYEQGKLIGYLAVFHFNTHEAEISGMVSPAWRRRGIFTTLLDAARKECQRRKLPSLLFIVQHHSASGQAFAAALHPQYDHSEYHMTWDPAVVPVPVVSSVLQFRQAQVEDLPILKAVTAAAFQMPVDGVDWYTEKAIKYSTRTYYLASIDSRVVGKIDVNYDVQEAYIAGFGVLPEYQGRGYGRQMMNWTIQEILRHDQQHIVLEVSVDNDNALGLYTSCGFRQVSSDDYYRQTI
ncbi:acetyltransferase [Dictyobacter vulcani]|uniref:Acetyltransferase n=1 Tax=Dictyobacter vulcani TaxID=2607529 RepID=A0A5J4KGS6_9CHLR|nr:GNAT family N-acetyltransferase [Dictyobacter vulcani]GER86923.1 acetyltransferase [Dictyobacter vulcani]